jgi:CheY-like chemotaxis protein
MHYLRRPMLRSILFVDDSAVARAATVRRLGERGLPVTALGSWREAERVDPTHFAAALLDIELGDGFGPDLAAWLRRTSPGLPIAFLTGGGPASSLAAARAFGPVFEKAAGVDEAIGWVVAAAGF